MDIEPLGAGKTHEADELYDGRPAYPPTPTDEEIEDYRSRRALRTPPKADINLEVPYLHQLWDTPQGFNGHWACGPSCAAMVLAYYGLLEPKPMDLPQPFPHSSLYGWYVSSIFAHNARTFDAAAPTRDGEGAGIYGAVVDSIGNAWGAHWRSPRGRGIRPLMDAFLPGVGNRVGFVGEPKRQGTIFMQRQGAEETMKACLEAGHPLIVSGRFTFRGKQYDHLIVVRGYYAEPGGELKWIVNDPYGFETTGAGFDGGNVVYGFDEIQPKWLCVFSGSRVPQPTGNPDHLAVRLFDRATNVQVGEGTLVKGTDKVYIKKLKV